MATGRDDFVIAFRSAFLKKKDKQKFSLLSLILLSIVVIILSNINFKPIQFVKIGINEIIYRSSYLVSRPENYIEKLNLKIKNHLNIMHAGPIWMTAEYLGGLVVMHNCESSQFQPVVANLENNFINPANSGIYGELEFDEIAVKALRQDLESSGQHKFETKVIIRDEAEQIIAKAQGIYVVRNFLGAV